MESPYHRGELEVQTRAGVLDMAARVGRSIHREIPASAAAFLREQPFLVVGASGRDGRVWASLLAGEPGFVRAESALRVRVAALPGREDPLSGAFARPAPAGLVVIEFASRRRMRLNGTGWAEDGSLVVEADQVYSNCPKYIQARAFDRAVRSEGRTRRAARLDDRQRAWIESSDTFFVATAFADGADASHRGGRPGFVRVEADGRLVWPDYQGNTMFQTLGNIAGDPRAGLLFLDFAEGSTLQVSGRAEIIWDERLSAAVPGAERLVALEIEEVVETSSGVPLRWRLLERSPFNP